MRKSVFIDAGFHRLGDEILGRYFHLLFDHHIDSNVFIYIYIYIYQFIVCFLICMNICTHIQILLKQMLFQFDNG